MKKNYHLLAGFPDHVIMETFREHMTTSINNLLEL